MRCLRNSTIIYALDGENLYNGFPNRGGGDKVSVFKMTNILKKKIYYKSSNKYMTVQYLQKAETKT